MPDIDTLAENLAHRVFDLYTADSGLVLDRLREAMLVELRAALLPQPNEDKTTEPDEVKGKALPLPDWYTDWIARGQLVEACTTGTVTPGTPVYYASSASTSWANVSAGTSMTAGPSWAEVGQNAVE